MKKDWGRYLALAMVIIAVVAGITYLESKKQPAAQSISILQNAESQIASSTASSTLVNASGTLTVAQLLKERASIIAQEEQEYQAAPEITDPTGFINMQPFHLSDFLENKVILLDFWTYSCINCIRTIPYLNAWYAKYKDYGLVIVGIHTPEFQFEQDYNNVATAVKNLGIQYPVVLDNDMGTWNAYQSMYWPNEYLINIDGFIVHNSVGEGDYAQTESAIQAALQQRSDALGLNLTIPTGTANPSATITINYNGVNSPETYFGAYRNEYLANGTQGAEGGQTLTLPSGIQQNELYLGGSWNFAEQYAENESAGAKIEFEYDAKNVYMVASASSPVTVQVLVDGKPINRSIAGSDVSSSGTITIQADRLYNIVNGATYGQHTLELITQQTGLDAYTFTFG